MKEHHPHHAEPENLERHMQHGVKRFSSFGISSWLAGIFFVILAIIFSVSRIFISPSIVPRKALFGALVLYIILVFARILFLVLSSLILKIRSRTWNTAFLVVGMNAAVMTGITFLGELARLTSDSAAIILFCGSVAFSFVIGSKIYRISLIETLALYALALAMLLVVFVVVELIFHAPLAGLMAAGSTR